MRGAQPGIGTLYTPCRGGRAQRTLNTALLPRQMRERWSDRCYSGEWCKVVKRGCDLEAWPWRMRDGSPGGTLGGETQQEHVGVKMHAGSRTSAESRAREGVGMRRPWTGQAGGTLCGVSWAASGLPVEGWLRQASGMYSCSGLRPRPSCPRAPPTHDRIVCDTFQKAGRTASSDSVGVCP